MRSKMLLIISIVMGLITTLLFFQYMKQVNSKKTASIRTVEVVVAKEQIQKNETINPDKLEIEQLPEQNVLPQMVKNVNDARGKLATAVIEKGEVLLTSHLGTELEEGVYVSRKVREGYRAVSVGVNFNQSVSNLIEPEDDVDVIFSEDIKGPNNQQLVQTTLLVEKARVLAVGRQMLTPENTKTPYAEFSSVTLELKPEDALKVVNASERGKIQLILNKRPLMNDQDNVIANQ